MASGEAIGLGSTNIFTMTFSDPSYGSSQIVNQIDAGVYQAIGLNLGRISQEQLTTLKNRLETTKTRLQNSDFSNVAKDDLIGDLLYTTAMAYHAELGTMNYITARTMQVNALTLPSETIFATKLKVMTLWGIPRYVSPGGLNMDADSLLQVVKPKDGNADTVKQYMLSSGMTSSALEHSVPEQLFSTAENKAEGISTVKALKIANDQGIPIYTVNQQNIATTLPQLQIDQQTKEDIQNAVNAGKVVTVSKTNISFNGWVGVGYIITNPETGAGAYMISGGTNGGWMFVLWAVLFLIAAVFAPEIGLFLMVGKIGGIVLTTFLTTAIGVIGTGIIKDIYNMPPDINVKNIIANFILQISLASLFILFPTGLVGFAILTLLAGFFDMETFIFVKLRKRRLEAYVC